MKNKPLFKRDFDLNEDKQVQLLLFEPYLSEDGWRCIHHIYWPEKKEKTFSGLGVDKLDAFLASLKVAEIFLTTKKEYIDGSLQWIGGSDLGLTFKVES